MIRSKKRVGIYAGTFDPIHLGHIEFAREAATNCQLDKVFFLVEPRPRRKQGVRALDHRTAMVQLALKNESQFGTIVLDQNRFTVSDTLPELQARFRNTDLLLLLGDDVFYHLQDWSQLETLVSSVGFIVGLRTSDEKTINNYVRTLERSRAIKINYEVFKPNLAAHASSKVKASLRRGQIPDGLAPKVLDYIRKHRLYSSELNSK